MRGLRTKTSIFYRQLCLSSYDIVVLTETRLTAGMLDAELFDSCYIVWRRNRDYVSTGQTRGRGVLIAVRKTIATILQPQFSSTAEDFWVLLPFTNNNKKNNLYLCVVYLCGQGMGLSFSAQLKKYMN